MVSRSFSSDILILLELFPLVNNFLEVFLVRGFYMNITDKIRALCKREGISMTELEKKLGFGNGSLTKGDNENIKLSRLRAIAKHFDVSLYYFFNEEDLYEKQVEEYENDKYIQFLITTPIFRDFCDQYRLKDGNNVLDLFEDFAKADSRYEEYREHYWQKYLEIYKDEIKAAEEEK